MAISKDAVTVVIPTFNEEETIGMVLMRLGLLVICARGAGKIGWFPVKSVQLSSSRMSTLIS